MNISGRTNYSYLFDSLNSNKNNNSLANMTMSVDFVELNTIRSGVYKQALNAYYAKEDSSNSTPNTSSIIDKFKAEQKANDASYDSKGNKTELSSSGNKFDEQL